MSKKITLHLTFEVETQGLTDAVLQRAWKHYTNYQEMVDNPEMLAGADHERRLVEALLASPALLEEFLRAYLAEHLSSMASEDAYQLTGAKRESEEVLQELLPQLPELSQAFFDDAIEQQVWPENTELVYAALKLQPKAVVIDTDRAGLQAFLAAADLKRTSLADVPGISPRLVNACRKSEIYTVAELGAVVEDLPKFRHVGEKTLKEALALCIHSGFTVNPDAYESDLRSYVQQLQQQRTPTA